jgi:hypothetical protein
MNHEIIKMIDRMFSDTSVARDQTKEKLEEILEHVESLLETL